MHTDTRIERPTDDVLAQHDRRSNDASTTYQARHRHNPNDHLPRHEKTELIPVVPREVQPARSEVGQVRVVVPLAPRPSAPLVPEPVAEVRVSLLERILRRLRMAK